MSKLRAIILLHEGFEELEAVAPIDLLSRAEVDVCLASMTSERLVRGRSGITIQADQLFEELDSTEDYDAVILPGGPGIKELRNQDQLCAFLQKHHSAGKIIACICAAPMLLLDAGLLPEHYTAHPSTLPELPEPKDEKCVWANNILTSGGAGTAIPFGLDLVEALRDQETRTRIADSICWS